MSNWIEHYEKTYKSLLTPKISGAKRGLQEGIGIRYPGFKIAFKLLLAQNKPWYNILETGTLRNPGNWKDGQSSVLFCDFIKAHGGSLRSIDVDKSACTRAKQALPIENFHVVNSDSVNYLKNLPNKDQIDLYYLDSYDVNWDDDLPSATHHYNEWTSIQHAIAPGTIVVIDDNARKLDGSRTGKGRLIVEELIKNNKPIIYDQYQIIFQV